MAQGAPPRSRPVWLGAMNVGFHLYPVLLQRSQRARLRAIMRRMQTQGRGA
ncbi:MAG TPA: hypothetical protein VGB85_11770 [Nannocystis sp.]|jgi:hypothetical protein